MDSFNIVAAMDGRGRPGSDDDLIAALLDYSPAIGAHPRGWTEIIISVPAVDLRQALTTGLSLLERTGYNIVSVEAMTTTEFDARVGFDEVPDLMSVTEVADTLHVSRQYVLRLIREHKLPGHRVGATYAVPRSAVPVKDKG